ncbi:META domain-containing protein [Bizionia paragorgiae]|uniref:META domain-containing protein n=1 Tax=Bizionia paragorgiae TaxID=283786 RepID=UPI00299D0007|nr:META domain-containing protein [Bizionia paragorgiae]MDX1271551.1 META domain-containing protein [Bizionia paragorgiae]
MNKSLVYLLTCSLLVFLFNCKDASKDPSKNAMPSESSVSTTGGSLKSSTAPISTFFIGFGSDSIWTLELSNEFITFTSEDSSFKHFKIKTPEVTRVADANIKHYKGDTPLGEVVITIAQEDSENEQEQPQYKTTLVFNKTKTEASKTFEGFGNYILDYRLNGTWVLESIKNEPVSVANFNKKLPTLIINAEEKTYSGFSGCNGLGGNLFTENDLIRFNHGISTLMACPDNKENKYRKQLQKTTQYNISETHLEFSNPNGPTVRYKKG